MSPIGFGSVAMAGDSFQKVLAEGIAHEQALDWDAALRLYEALVQRLETETPQDARWHARNAEAEFRRGNALMVLRRMDDARTAFDAGLHAAKESGDSLILAEGLTAAGVFAGTTGDLPRAERFLFEALNLFSDVDAIAGRQGAGWAMLNLGTIYGKTGRLDLAFVTLDKARERLYAIENWVGVAAAWEAQAQLRRAIGDEDRWREDLAEAVIFYDRQGMTEKAGRLRELLKGKLL